MNRHVNKLVFKQINRSVSHLSGTKTLKFTFDERNTALTSIPRSQLYPVLTARRPEIKRVQDVLTNFNSIEHDSDPLNSLDSTKLPEFEVRGRISSIRTAGKHLTFIDLVENDKKLQIVLNDKKLATPLTPEQINVRALLRTGDAISAVGIPWRTKSGQLSILCTDAIGLLAPCLHPLLEKSAAKVIRKHNRVAELKAFEDARTVLKARAVIVQSITNFFINEDFMPVQTPILSLQKGGASAETFRTEMANTEKQSVFLRVAPELWLKKMIIGGFDRVFEIGSSFRNEGVDATHNPEFTTCEFYAAYFSLSELMDITQKLFAYVAKTVATTFPEYEPNCEPFISKSDWKVIDFTKDLETAIKRPIMGLNLAELQEICTENKIPINSEDEPAKLLDKLGAHFLEPQCTSPTFIINHPSVMAPLAKEGPKGISRRFELFINGREYVNAYEEENDPDVQLAKLKQQDPTVPDSAYVDAMKWGLPPTGGWGLGVDRLVMLLTNSERIGDVLSFGDITQVQRL